MKSKKFFSLSLYVDGLKQLKKLGIFSFVIIAFLTLIFSYNNSTVEYSLISMMPTLVLSFMMAAPVMTLEIFSLFNKRNSADFYYAIPYTRTCIYISYVLAVITWTIGIIMVITIPSLVIAVVLRHSTLVLSQIFMDLIGIIVCCLLVIAAVSLAMSLTGKRFSNILLSGIIIFLPRIIICLFTDAVVEIYSYLATERFWGLFNDKYNLVTNSIGSILSFEFNFICKEGIMYTLILAIIYFVLACICFRIRKSETADSVSNNKFTHLLITTAAPVLICTASMTIVTWNTLAEGYSITSQLSELFPYYLVGIIVYFVFEFIVNRRFKVALKKLPNYLFAILISMIFYSAVWGVGEYTSSLTLDSDEIDYITIAPDLYDDFDSFTYDYYDNYYNLLSYEIKLDDTKIKELVSDGLELINNEEFNNPYEYYSINIGIHANGKVYYRNLSSISDTSLINNYIDNNEELIKRATTLPKYSDVYIDPNTDYFKITPSNDNLKELYNTYIEEMNTLDYETRLTLLYGDSFDSSYEKYDINIYFSYKNTFTYIKHADITKEYTPKTYELYETIIEK